VKGHGVPLREHPTDEGSRLLREVLVDQEERRPGVLALQHVEEGRRGRRVRSVVERQIDRRVRPIPRHVPDRVAGPEGFEQEREGRRVRQEHGSKPDRGEEQQHRV
jgi:hypothetical protein